MHKTLERDLPSIFLDIIYEAEWNVNLLEKIANTSNAPWLLLQRSGKKDALAAIKEQLSCWKSWQLQK